MRKGEHESSLSKCENPRGSGRPPPSAPQEIKD